jgi:protein TonB
LPDFEYFGKIFAILDENHHQHNKMKRPILMLWLLPIMIMSYPGTTYAQDTGVYTVVDEQPEPVGGLKAFYDYIEKNLRYPEEAKQKNISGRVVVKFIVDENGKLTDPQIVRSLCEPCDAEALRLIKEAPPWKPGKKDGKVVKVEVTRPINFSPN